MSVKAKLFSLFLLLSWIPDLLMNSFTIFIPKKQNTNRPSDLRPLSISSNLLRLFHKVLMKRISASFTPDSYQFGFQSKDGVACDIDKLNYILSSNKRKLKPYSIAILDLCKAFDSISHRYLINCLEEHNVPPLLVRYIMYVYRNSATSLSFKGESSNLLHPTRGMRLGDPLSPLLFLMVF